MVFEKKTLFLSYCNRDKEIADIVDNAIKVQLKDEIKISRYSRDVEYKQSFKEFMNSIKDHDFVLTLVTDSYLKSVACMYEVGEILKNRSFGEKILFIVLSENDRKYYKNPTKKIGADIYNNKGQIGYVKYWETEYQKTLKNTERISSLVAKEISFSHLRAIEKIINFDIKPFIEYLNDANGKSFEDLFMNNFIDIISCICPEFSNKAISEPKHEEKIYKFYLKLLGYDWDLDVIGFSLARNLRNIKYDCDIDDSTMIQEDIIIITLRIYDKIENIELLKAFDTAMVEASEFSCVIKVLAEPDEVIYDSSSGAKWELF